MRLTYIKQAWLVIVLAVVFAAALAGVQITLGPRIGENQRSETYGQVPLLVPGAEADKTYQETIASKQVYRAFDSTGRQIGWVVRAGGQGYADRLELLIGLDAAGRRITGLYVLEQKETPGLGNHITDDDWRRQFVGKSASAPLAVTRLSPAADNEILAITGATISSESVCGIVNRTIAELREHLVAGEIRNNG